MKIFVVGIGVEGRASLTQRARKIVESAGLLAGGARHLGLFPESRAKRAVIKGPLEKTARAIKRHLEKGRGAGPAVVLATGDPLVFGIGDYLIRRFGSKRVEFIPGVSVFQEALARVRESANGVKLLSAHGREGGLEALCADIMNQTKAVVYTDSATTPAVIARALLKKGSDGWRCHVCESLGADDERVTSSTLSGLARRRTFSPLNVLVLIKKPGGKEKVPRRAGALPDSSFASSGGMMTKEEVRAVTLAKMDVGDNSVVWDIGAGSGTVSVEAAMRAASGRVYAIEKDAKRVKDIIENRARFGAFNLTVIHGAAPDKLKGLPRPDAVFVGGGGADIGKILSYAAGRLEKGGRLVVNAVTLDTAGRARAFFRKKLWPVDIALMSVAKGADAGTLTMLKSHNPVFIMTAVRP